MVSFKQLVFSCIIEVGGKDWSDGREGRLTTTPFYVSFNSFPFFSSSALWVTYFVHKTKVKTYHSLVALSKFSILMLMLSVGDSGPDVFGEKGPKAKDPSSISCRNEKLKVSLFAFSSHMSVLPT